MNKKKAIFNKRVEKNTAKKIASLLAAKLAIYNKNPKILQNQSIYNQEQYYKKVKAYGLATERIAFNYYINFCIPAEHRDEFLQEYYTRKNAEIDAFYANEKAKKLAIEKANAKPTLKLLQGTTATYTEQYKFQYYTVTITPNVVYINKALYKSQVAKIADLLTDDGKYALDISLYRFKQEKPNKHVKRVSKNYTTYVNWENTSNTVDVYGDKQLYQAGILSYDDLRSKYSKGVEIKSLYSSYELNRKIKSIIAIAKELSDYYEADENNNSMWQKLHPKETPVWEDPKGHYDEFTIDVKINAYVFTLVNSSLRNSKYINYILIDELPLITNVKTTIKLADGKYINDTNVEGLSTKKFLNRYYLLINGYKLTAYNPNHSIECNKSGKMVAIDKNRSKEGYYILKRQCLASATYTDNEEKRIFEYLTKDADTPLFIRGGTTKMIEMIEDIYYYAHKELHNTSSIYIHIEEESSYDYDALDALIAELNLKEEGYANNTVSQHLDNIVVDEGFLEAFLYNEGINLEKIDEDDNLYIIHIR